VYAVQKGFVKRITRRILAHDPMGKAPIGFIPYDFILYEHETLGALTPALKWGSDASNEFLKKLPIDSRFYFLYNFN